MVFTALLHEIPDIKELLCFRLALFCHLLFAFLLGSVDDDFQQNLANLRNETNSSVIRRLFEVSFL